MAKLLKFEFRKLLRSKIVYIVLGIAVGFVVMNALVLLLLDNLARELEPSFVTSYSAYGFTKGALNNSFFTIVGVFIAIYATEDFSHGTCKNVIAKGFKRLEVYFSKYIVSLISIIVMALLCFVTSLGMGLALFENDFGSITDNIPVIIIGQFLCLLVFHSMFYTIAYTLGKSGPAIALNIIAPLGITLILTIGTLLINKEDFDLSRYWIDGIFSNFSGGSSMINMPGGTTDESLFASNFILIFVYLGISEALGIIFANRKQF